MLCVCAVFKEGTEMVYEPVTGEVTSKPNKKLIGYAVFENGEMISRIYSSYGNAKRAMEEILKERESDASRPGMSG